MHSRKQLNKCPECILGDNRLTYPLILDTLGVLKPNSKDQGLQVLS